MGNAQLAGELIASSNLGNRVPGGLNHGIDRTTQSSKKERKKERSEVRSDPLKREHNRLGPSFLTGYAGREKRRRRAEKENSLGSSLINSSFWGPLCGTP